ncbi:MAG: glycosyltransferase family 4 protein [Desulfobacterales bacterium]|uniref:Glycosyltransferase family 4 protein n=1 Tax=Candidatus Desulfatibia vada TaxID=2841696 RepID=A0A8J6P7P2_9BACT|nr:glycosyltransferase family 4 protein [Candidatus Desulfatibia vada]MBL7218311.1 glycosyltransferase family 4 protein [Desulfobacteraceae bacterium]
MSSETRPLLVHIVTVPEFFQSFFRGQLEFLDQQGFEVGLICSPDKKSNPFSEWPVHYYPVSIERKISPLADAVSIWKILRLFQSINPDIVHVHTSKAGLVGMVAAWIYGVRVRIFTIHGFRWVTKKGISRLLIKASNWLTCLLADRVFCVSKSNLELGVEQGICRIDQAQVLCRGSINGVDAETRFNPGIVADGLAVREKFGIPKNAFVFGFVGRIVKDKGIAELAKAWKKIRSDFPDAHLMMVGKAEAGDPVSGETLDCLKNDNRVHFTGYSENVAPYYSAMDAFVLPSYREGFPVTPLEASAMGLPVIASRIRGCIDAVVEGQTGFLVERGSSSELERAMRKLLKDRNAAKRMGEAGREFVLQHFKPKPIWKEISGEYKKLLMSGGF